MRDAGVELLWALGPGPAESAEDKHARKNAAHTEWMAATKQLYMITFSVDAPDLQAAGDALTEVVVRVAGEEHTEVLAATLAEVERRTREFHRLHVARLRTLYGA